MVEDKIQKLFSNEKILKEFLEQKDIDDAKKFLENRGIETSTEELKDLAKLLNEYAEKGNNITEEDLNKIVGGTTLERKTYQNKSDKCIDIAGVNFIFGLPLGAASIITGAMAANSNDKGLGGSETRDKLIGTSIATGVLSIANVISGIKNAHDACWWKYIGDHVKGKY